MLSLAKVTTGAAAASYYEEADDYYTADRAPSAWFGAAAERLQLDGEVNAETFRALLDGRMPDGQVIHNAAEGRRGGTDLTFSAPKSVSMQALIGGDARLIDAHERAVRATLTYAQQWASYRVTEDGHTRSEKSQALLVATFRHDLSRETDPQLHTHAVVINATQRADGAWRALEHSEFYRQQKLLGALYRSELALEVKRLGYEVRVTHGDGRFELAHLAPKHIEAFSSRSQAIEAALAKQGKTRDEVSAREKESIALATREKKTDVDRAALRADWRERSEQLGIDYGGLRPAQELRSTNELQPSQAAATEAVRYAIEHTTERQAVVTEPQLVRAALEHGTGETDLRAISEALRAAVKSGELLKADEHYTTPAAQQLERDILELEARGRAAVAPIASTGDMQERLASTTLNEGQRAAATLALTTTARVSAIQGSAGTGKTTMLSELRAHAEAQGYRLVGIAPSAAAVRELSKAGIAAQTLAAFKHRESPGLDARSIVVLDEAGMTATRDMHQVLNQVEAANARVVLVGDVQQLKAIEAGKPFAQLQAAGIARVQMDEIQRQRDAQLKQAVEHAARGDVARSLAVLEQRIVEIDRAQPRHQAIAQEYAQLEREQRQDTLIVAGTHAARESINAHVRHELGLAGQGVSITTLERKDLTQAQAKSSVHYQAGDIVQATKHYESLGLKRGERATVIDSGDGRVMLERGDGARVEWRPALQPAMTTYRSHTREVAVGDVMRFTANDYRRGFINGERAIVTAIDERGALTLAKEDGARLDLDASQPLAIEHGYCTTVHSSQGQTSERVLIEADTRSATSNESAYYVAISRARSGVTIYTDDKQMLPAAMSRSDTKAAALDLPHEHGSLAMG